MLLMRLAEVERRRVSQLLPDRPAVGSPRETESFSLHVIGDARAQFHGGGQSEASGCRRRHVGLQNCFQSVQDVVLADLTSSTITGGELFIVRSSQR